MYHGDGFATRGPVTCLEDDVQRAWSTLAHCQWYEPGSSLALSGRVVPATSVKISAYTLCAPGPRSCTSIVVGVRFVTSNVTLPELGAVHPLAHPVLVTVILCEEPKATPDATAVRTTAPTTDAEAMAAAVLKRRRPLNERNGGIGRALGGG
jgi:hypothetical protein